MEIVVTALIALVAGGLIGSLINIVATRLPADLPLFGAPLRTADGVADWRNAIPFIGTRNPGTGQFDLPNLATQLGAAALVAIALFQHGFTLQALQTTVLASILLTILRIDWQHHLIFLLTIWPGIALALVFSMVDSWSSFASSAGAGLAAAGVFLLLYLLAIVIYKRRALGLGDVFLAGLIGTMVGLQFVTITLLLGMIIAALGGLALVAAKVRSRTDYIPYGAYLSFAAIIIVVLVG